MDSWMGLWLLAGLSRLAGATEDVALKDSPIFAAAITPNSTVYKLKIMDTEHFAPGTLPTELGRATQITHIHFGEWSALVGTLPTEIGELTRLDVMTLGAKMMGTIPTEIGQLTEMEKLNIEESNAFEGTLPTTMGRMEDLKYLRIYKNRLSGKVPTQMHHLALKDLSILSLGCQKLQADHWLTKRFPTALGCPEGTVPEATGKPPHKESPLIAYVMAGFVPLVIACSSAAWCIIRRREYLKNSSRHVQSGMPGEADALVAALRANDPRPAR